MLSLNVRTPVHENNHTSHRVQDPSLIRIISQQLHPDLDRSSTSNPTSNTWYFLNLIQPLHPDFASFQKSRSSPKIAQINVDRLTSMSLDVLTSAS